MQKFFMERAVVSLMKNAFFCLFAIFILHSRESELYRYALDGMSTFAWKLPFPRCLGHLFFT